MFTNSKMMTRVAAAAAVVMIGSDQKSFFANALQMTTSDHLSPTYVLGGPRPASPTNEEDGDVSREPVPPKNQGGRWRFFSGFLGKTGSSGSPKHNPDASIAVDDAEYETAVSDVSINGYPGK
jgi:hypothetical protein